MLEEEREEGWGGGLVRGLEGLLAGDDVRELLADVREAHELERVVGGQRWGDVNGERGEAGHHRGGGDPELDVAERHEEEATYAPTAIWKCCWVTAGWLTMRTSAAMIPTGVVTMCSATLRELVWYARKRTARSWKEEFAPILLSASLFSAPTISRYDRSKEALALVRGGASRGAGCLHARGEAVPRTVTALGVLAARARGARVTSSNVYRPIDVSCRPLTQDRRGGARDSRTESCCFSANSFDLPYGVVVTKVSRSNEIHQRSGTSSVVLYSHPISRRQG